MRAVVHDAYGPPEVLHLEDVEKPIPGEDEVLIRIRATTVNRLDCATREANRSGGTTIFLLSHLIFGLRGPRRRILGTELAGEIEAVGTSVSEFAVGDHVFGITGLRFGAHAEYTCVPESARIDSMPAGVSFEDAAAVSDGALNALWCLKGAEIREGQRILIYGASGSIGTAAVQLARHFGADITAVCGTKNLELMRSLGADRVIDYTEDDFTRSGETYDVIFDAVGKHSFKRSKGSLKAGGRYLATDGFRNLFLAIWTRLVGDKKVIFRLPPRYAQQDLRLIRDLMESGKYRAVIDRRYPMEQVVDAARYVDTEQKTGNVVLLVSDG
ncbi:MAG TPA: NAD(P)-dependent alcohol dehydrogenase [Candidatus Solibacter sp.]|jgi:NADPH:quinone reductase-like Zn-dependent oxidoreductase|nr:NAD(P)-dependent alcohol dehydrogenase [Candidatus Solibacter sp.]